MLFKYLTAFSLVSLICALPDRRPRQTVSFADPRTNGGSMLDDGQCASTKE